MTHEEFLQDLLTRIQAQLRGVSTPVQPTTPVDPPKPVDEGVSEQFVALVAQRPPLDLASIFFHLARAFTPAELAYARAHNVPGSTPPAPLPDASENAGARNEEHNSAAFDPDHEESYRFMSGPGGDRVTKKYPAKETGTFVIGVYDAGGITSGVSVAVTGPGVSVFWPRVNLAFSDDVPGIQAGQTYEVAISSMDDFKTTVTMRKKR